MKNFVPLETVVDNSVLQAVDSLSLQSFHHESEIRGRTVKWLCLSRRLLWMAEGHEHIEPELLDWIDAIPTSSILYDIGASNGIFALYAAARGLCVHAFEPDPSNYFLLSYNNYLNDNEGLGKVAGCYNLALGNEDTISNMYIKKMELGGHQKILNKTVDVLGNQLEPEHVHRVMQMRCDSVTEIFNIASPTHMKIDVDGSEFELLCGAEQALQSAQSVFIELTESNLSTFALTFFRQRGFELVIQEQVQNYGGLYNCVFERR